MIIGCPECEETFDVELGEDTEVGDVIICPDCSSEMEITSISADGTVLVELTEEELDEEFEDEDEDEEEDSDSD